MTQQTPIVPAGTATGAHPGPAHQPPAGSRTLRLPAAASAAVVSRRHVRQLLQAWQLAAVIDMAELMASELVANAVTAAQAPDGRVFPEEPRLPPKPSQLGVRRTEVSVIIEVADPNPEPPVLQRPGPMDEGGRGLRIIEILATRWGYYAAQGGGKVVWCEIALAGTGPAGLLALSRGGRGSLRRPWPRRGPAGGGAGRRSGRQGAVRHRRRTR